MPGDNEALSSAAETIGKPLHRIVRAAFDHQIGLTCECDVSGYHDVRMDGRRLLCTLCGAQWSYLDGRVVSVPIEGSEKP